MKGTVFAVALNHQSQIDAWHDAFQQPPYKASPKTPVWFIKPRNTVIANGESIPQPAGEQVFSGATLAVVIGKKARRISVQQAADYIAGYALANEVSLAESNFYRPAIKAKCRDGFCPLGTVQTNVDTAGLEIITEVNGIAVERWSLGDLVRTAPQLLAALSEFITLQPGDAVLLGTPQQRVAIQPGDRVRISAAGLPPLENQLVDMGEQA